MSLLLLAACGGAQLPVQEPAPWPPDDWEPMPPTWPDEEAVYRVVVSAGEQSIATELGGHSSYEVWRTPDGRYVPVSWEEHQNIHSYACPGPSLSASITIQQPVRGGVRRDSESAVWLNVHYSPYRQPTVQWQQELQVDLTARRELSHGKIAVVIERRG